MIKMNAKTAELGETAIEEANIINFDPGLLAFENLHRFVMLDIVENPHFKWLQSLDNPEVTFLLVDPFTVKNDYSVDLSAEVREKLDIEAAEDVIIYTIVTVPASGLKDATTNLVGPLVFNWRKKVARQIICEGNIIKYPLMKQ